MAILGLLDFIFNLPTGGFSRDGGDEDDIEPESAPVAVAPDPGRCNNCGWTFHPMHIHCRCPRGCGGTIY